VKFGFVAKHREAWPVNLLCEALGVSRSGFYSWLNRPRSQRSLDDEVLGRQVRQSFLSSDRTYGSRRVWHDVLALGQRCGLHRIERLMRQQALRARPRRRGLPKDHLDYIERFYNPTRRHSTVGYGSPIDFEKAQKA
jgi:putative transposase